MYLKASFRSKTDNFIIHLSRCCGGDRDMMNNVIHHMPISCKPICINLIYGHVEHENTICKRQRKGEENKSGANNKLIVCGFTLKEKGFSVIEEKPLVFIDPFKPQIVLVSICILCIYILYIR